MNDKDIIRCLRHCNGGDCETCKALGACDATWKFHKAALDLINRQKSEIEELNKDLIRTEREWYVMGKNDAVKIFAEELKKQATTRFDWNDCVDVEDIDNLVKEMTGTCDG